MRARPILSAVPTVPLSTLALALAAHAGLKALFFWRPYQTEVALPVELVTGGLVTTVTLAGIVSWLVLVGAVMLGTGRLRPAHIGLTWTTLREALPVLGGLWVLAQIVQVLLGTASGGAAFAPSAPGLAAALGQRLQAIVGSGLLEETTYRGFLLVQLYGLLRLRVGRDHAVAWAIVLSSAYFGLNHLPAGLHSGLSLTAAFVFVGHAAMVGALFAVLYLRTGNLFVAAGAHALINDPVPLFAAPADPALVVLVAVVGLMLAWPTLAQHYQFTVGTIEGEPAF